MTERLYEERPLRGDADATFTARVLAVEPRGGGASGVRLDRTLFYPTGGGQPCDRGSLGGLPVVDVVEVEGDVVHVVEGAPAPAVGGEVTGRVDAARRRDHMEQHSGQHLLSAVLVRRFRVATLSFHLGADASTIDVACEDAAALLAPAEEEANALVRACLPVTAAVFRGERAGEVAGRLRKAPEPEALASARGLRVVQIGDGADVVDRDACCGTHVASTGALGLVLLLGAERARKGATRLTFVVGGRAVRAARARLDALDRTGALLTVGHPALPERAQKLLEEAKALRRDLREAREQVLAHEAGAADVAGGVATRLLDGGEAADAKAFATALVRAHPEALAAVVHRGERATLVVARGERAPAADAAAVLRAALAPHGGKGGGSAAVAQGAAPDPATAPALLEAATLALRAAR